MRRLEEGLVRCEEIMARRLDVVGRGLGRKSVHRLVYGLSNRTDARWLRDTEGPKLELSAGLSLWRGGSSKDVVVKMRARGSTDPR